MSESKLVSVRLDAEDIKEIDRQCKSLGYVNRSFVINKAVSLAVYMMQHGQFRKLWNFNPRFGDVVDKFELDFHREVKV